jgi:hypothetical protein
MYNFISNYLSKENGAKEEQSDADADLSTADDELSYFAFDCLARRRLLRTFFARTRAFSEFCIIAPFWCTPVIRKPSRGCLLVRETDADAFLSESGVLRDMVQDAVKKHIYSTFESEGKDDAKG